MDIVQQLGELGFGAKKSLLYSVLLQARSGTAAELAETAGIKRTTSYELLEDLVADGLAVVSFSGRKRVYTATQPDNLQLRLERQRALLDEMLPELNGLFNRTSHKPRVRYYEGLKGVRQFHDELLQTPFKEYFYFGSMRGLESVVGRRYLKSFVRRRIEKNIRAHAIRIREQEIDEPLLMPSNELNREVRYISLPSAANVVNMTLYDGKVAIVASTGENYALIIESDGLFTLLKLIWDYLWSVAEK